MDPGCANNSELVSRLPAASTASTHRLSQKYGAGCDPSSQSGRSERSPWLRQRFQIAHLLLVAFLACCLPLTSASATPYNEIDTQMVDTVKVDVDVASTSELLKSSLHRLARTGTLLVDHHPEPKPWNDNTNAHNELRRQVFSNEDDPKPTTSSDAKVKSSSASKASASKTASGGGIPVATGASKLPSPYDQGFNGNITESCSNFVYGFLRNSTFQACLPFSLLLQVS